MRSYTTKDAATNASMSGKDERMGNAKWSENIQAFWFGGNGCEFIAWKGSYHIFIYCGDYPSPPVEMIQHHSRIETEKDFDEALATGQVFSASYEKGKTFWQKLKETDESQGSLNPPLKG